MDVIEQVALEPCSVCYDLQDVIIEALSGYCDDCNNTQRYWRDLSRRCPGCCDCDETQSSNEPRCGGTKRVSNVSLEGVLYELDAPWVDFVWDDESGRVVCGVCNEQGEAQFQGWGYNELEAACAALLNSIKKE